MIKKESIDNQLNDEIYPKISPFNWKLIIMGTLLLFIGFMVNFPVRRTIKNAISNKLATLRSCPINYERLELGYFLQKAKFQGPIFSGRCYGQGSQNPLRLESFNMALIGPSINPPGLKFHLGLKKNKTNLNIYPVLSYPKIGLEIKNSVIDGKFIQSLTGGLFKLHGQIKINSQLELNKNNLVSGSINIVSKNLSIPPQNIMNFLFPYLNFGDLNIKGIVKGINELSLSSINLGSKTSPIITNLKGVIKLNPQNIRQSNLDLKGKIKFAPEFIKKFAIINLFIAAKQKDSNGFYSLSIKGPMGRPKVKID